MDASKLSYQERKDDMAFIMFITEKMKGDVKPRMVEIGSNAVLVEPLNSRKDPELTRAYRTMMLRLKRAGITPKKHIMDNEVSDAM